MDNLDERIRASQGQRLGFLVSLDLYDCKCDLDRLRELDLGKTFVEKAVDDANLTPIGFCAHQFENHRSWTATCTLIESHVFFHTWSQHKYASVDIFTCSEKFPVTIIDAIIDFFQPEKFTLVATPRGEKVFGLDESNPLVMSKGGLCKTA